MTEKTRNFGELLAENKAELSPGEIDDQLLNKLAVTSDPVKIYEVTADEKEEYGNLYTITFQASDGTMYMKSLWHNPQRDATLNSLMRNLADGPISGLRWVNRGSEKKPFFVLVPV
jgi:hypothetical protein